MGELLEKNDYIGQLHYSKDFSNTYHHLSKSHSQQRNQAFNGFVYISADLYLMGLYEGQCVQLQSCDPQWSSVISTVQNCDSSISFIFIILMLQFIQNNFD